MASAEQINPLLLHLLLLGREQPHFPKTFHDPFSCFSALPFFFPQHIQRDVCLLSLGEVFVPLENPRQAPVSYKSQPQEAVKSTELLPSLLGV